MAKLTLEQITPYIPYRVKGFNSIGKIVEFTLADGRYHLDKGFTPILRPFNNLENDFFNSEKGYDEFYAFLNDWVIELVDTISRDNIKGDELKELIDNIPYLDMQVLFKWHFDVFGLIEKGLAKNIFELEPKHLKEVHK